MDNQLRILIVEDSENDALLIIRRLKKGGIDPLWERVQDAESLEKALKEKSWDLVLSDYSMPDFDGLAALRIYQQTGQDIPFIIVSAMVGEDAAVNAMVEGAHDYLMKDRLDRLIPAIQRELREAEIRRDKRAYEQEIIELNASLEQRVIERTRELEDANRLLKEAQEELLKRERMAVLDQLTATFSHELRNPLGVIRSSNFYLQRFFKDKPPKADKHFRRIDDQVLLCETLMMDLVEYARNDPIDTVVQPLAPWLEQIIQQVGEKMEVTIGLHLPDDLPRLSHDRERMIKVVTNLLINAVQAVEDRTLDPNFDESVYKPKIDVKVRHDEEHITIEVADNGIGMSADICQRAFDPLFTTRAKGIGIGLSNVKKIVEEHHGHAVLESRAGVGTRVTLCLPLQPRARKVGSDS